MKIMLVTKEPEIAKAALAGFHPSDKTQVVDDWKTALAKSKGVDLMFVDILATLDEPGKIAGYEVFAQHKMTHPTAKDIPLVIISPPTDYDLDFMAGWPNFVLGHIQRPVSEKIFRRASTWV